MPHPTIIRLPGLGASRHSLDRLRATDPARATDRAPTRQRPACPR
jgi:hypothetical protein